MKKVKVCRICGVALSKNLAYHAEVEREVTNPVTGEFKYEKVVGPICPVCTDRCGYKVSKKKLEKFKEEGE